MSVKFRSLFVIVIAGLLVLTGCSTPPPASVGVQVGDHVTNTSEIDEVVSLIGSSTSWQYRTASIVEVYVLSGFAEQFAADHDVEVTETEIDEARGSEDVFVDLADEPAIDDFERKLIRIALITRDIPNADALAGYDVVINPRYGVTWDGEESTLLSGSTSLSDDNRA